MPDNFLKSFQNLEKQISELVKYTSASRNCRARQQLIISTVKVPDPLYACVGSESMLVSIDIREPT